MALYIFLWAPRLALLQNLLLLGFLWYGLCSLCSEDCFERTTLTVRDELQVMWAEAALCPCCHCGSPLTCTVCRGRGRGQKHCRSTAAFALTTQQRAPGESVLLTDVLAKARKYTYFQDEISSVSQILSDDNFFSELFTYHFSVFLHFNSCHFIRRLSWPPLPCPQAQLT